MVQTFSPKALGCQLLLPQQNASHSCTCELSICIISIDTPQFLPLRRDSVGTRRNPDGKPMATLWQIALLLPQWRYGKVSSQKGSLVIAGHGWKIMRKTHSFLDVSLSEFYAPLLVFFLNLTFCLILLQILQRHSVKLGERWKKPTDSSHNKHFPFCVSSSHTIFKNK